MTTHHDHTPVSRRARRGIGIGASAIVLSAAFGVAYHQQVVGADEAPTARAHAPTSRAPDTDCDHLWDRVPVSGLPRAAWESAAQGVGLSAQGSWVSVDGLSWEHLDGSVIVVATPRSSSSDASPGAVCRTDGPARDGAEHATGASRS